MLNERLWRGELSAAQLPETTEATPGFASQELLERQMAEAEREAKAEGHSTLQALVLANLKICVLHGLA